MDPEQWAVAKLLLSTFFAVFVLPALLMGLVWLVQAVMNRRQRGRLARGLVSQQPGVAERPR